MISVVQVVADEQSQQELIDRARGALSQSAWVVGECASRFRGNGGTLAEFASRLEFNESRVRQMCSVWERFGESRDGSPKAVADAQIRNIYPGLTWTHFRTAVAWDDARAWLTRAGKERLSNLEMIEARESSVTQVTLRPGETRGETSSVSTEKNEPQAVNEPEITRDDQEYNQVDDDPPPVIATIRNTPVAVREAEPVAIVDHAAQFAERFSALESAVVELLAIASTSELSVARGILADKFPGLFALKVEKPKRFQPPTVEEVEEFCREKGFKHFDSTKFVGFYGSKGWQGITDWRSRVLSSLEWCAKAGGKVTGAVAVPAGKYDHIDQAQ